MSDNRILLTGAGFSHNFGLPLARQVWQMLFNDRQIQRAVKIRNKMLDNYDYEALYSLVIQEEVFEDEKDIFLSRVDKVFNEIFEGLSIEAINQEEKLGIRFHDIIAFINLFKHSCGQDRYFFTLNQDLFLERLFLANEATLIAPYIGNCLDNHRSGDRQIAVRTKHNVLEYNESFKNNDGLMLTEEELEERKKAFHKFGPRKEPLYFKLHGSIGWRYKTPERSGAPLVMGTQKSEIINREPLFREYMKVFNQALSIENSCLLTIGYGFADKHINDEIVRAIKKYGLKLHVLNPQSIERFKEGLEKKSNESNILYRAIHGYYETSLARLFPWYQTQDPKAYEYGVKSNTLDWLQLRDNFFPT